MGLREWQIIFDNPYKTYYVGQTISGNVHLTFDTPIKLRGISICFKGEANTLWTVEETSRNENGEEQKTQVDIYGHEEYYKIQYYLVGSPAGGEIELPVGTQTFPFTYLLPPTLPSSFEGQYGHVRYTAKITLDIPWKFDKEIKDVYTILSPLDLNLNTRLKESFNQEMEKFFCCCWCRSGPLTFRIRVPQTGYVPGQTISIYSELDNLSNVDIEDVNYVFRKKIVYHTTTPRRETKTEVIVLSEAQAPSVPKQESKTWYQEFPIPSLPPSSLANCSLIDIAYELEISPRTTGFHQDLNCVIPITIGTVPLVGKDQQKPMIDMGPTSVPDTTTLNMNPPATTPPTNNYPPPTNGQSQIGWQNPYQGYPHLGEPVYQPSQFGTATIQDKHDSQYVRLPANPQYSPMYPVFNYNQQPQ